MAYAPTPRSSSLAEFGRNAGGGMKLVVGMLVLMWVLEIVDYPTGGFLDQFGIYPRDVDGLTGIVAAPFLHLGFGHLMSNSVPFLVLGAMIAVSGAARVLAVTAMVMLVSGLGVWFTAPPASVTIGASGVVFGFAAYLVFRGIFTRKLGQIAIGVLVVLIWGSAFAGGLIPQEGISWQAHLFGAFGGLLSAALFRGEAREPAARSSSLPLS